MLALNVEKSDFAEIEQVAVEAEPLVHVPLVDVMGQMIEVVEPHALRVRLADPVELGIEGRGVTVLIYEIDQAAADPDDCWHIHQLSRTVERYGTPAHGMIEGMPGICDAPTHRRGARPMFVDEAHCVAAGLGVDQIGNIALLPDLDGVGLVRCDMRIALPGENVAQHLWIFMRESDKGETVGSGRIIGTDFGIGGVMRERTHK